MSKRRDLEQHVRQLADMREIMQSMKALAFMEAHKLAQFLDAQHQSVHTIEAAAADFLHFYPELLTPETRSANIYLLIGSERGFCGEFNETLLRNVPAAPETTLIAVGHKLHNLLAADTRDLTLIDGANVAEEVGAVLMAIVDTLAALQREQGLASIVAIFHRDADNSVCSRMLLPPFAQLPAAESAPGYPPLLNLTPQQFFSALIDRYLFAALNEILYTSLLLESNSRVQHLAGAVKHLEDKSVALQQRSRTMRQEEITEEIEVILLSAEELSAPIL